MLVLAGSVVLAVLWVAVTHPFEGRVIYEFSANHGIHRYDFLGLIPPLLALVWLVHTD